MTDRQLRAEVLLLAQLVEAHGRDGVEGLDEDIYAESPRNQFEGALAAAEGAGLLGPDGLAWLRAIDARLAAPPAELELSDEGRERVRAWLTTLDEFDRMVARDQLGRVGAAEAEGPDDDEVVEHADPLLELKAVLPGPDATGGARILAVECYGGGLVVRSELAREIPAELRAGSTIDIHDHFRDRDTASSQPPTVSDDAGTEYVPQGGGGGMYVRDEHWVTEGTFSFAPGAPTGASTLTVELVGERFNFDVAGVAALRGV